MQRAISPMKLSLMARVMQGKYLEEFRRFLAVLSTLDPASIARFLRSKECHLAHGIQLGAPVGGDGYAEDSSSSEEEQSNLADEAARLSSSQRQYP